MIATVISKSLRALVTLALLVTVTFVIMRNSGDPTVALLSEDASPEALEAMRSRLGLDRSLWAQYFDYAGKLLQGDLGNSFIGGRKAFDVVMDRLPATLSLMGLAAIFAIVAGTASGIYAALHRNSWFDRGLMVFASFGFSVPNFVIGILLILLFAATWKILPTTGSASALHYVLPVITLGSADMAVFARFTRSAMLEELGRHYVRTAQAKGLPWRKVVLRHSLPNAAIALVTVLGLYAGRLIAGAVVTENVFGWPGIGSLFVASVKVRDYAVIQAIVLLIGFTMVCANLLVDLSYLWLDPRTRGARARLR